MKHINIECPQGYEIDKEKSTFEKIVFKEVKELPKKWEELKKIAGSFVTNDSRIVDYYSNSPCVGNENIFVTTKQAEASIALAQLSQLREVYRKGWTPNWNNMSGKYCISMRSGVLIIEYLETYSTFLAFQDKQTVDLFLENFKDLILQASPLLF